MGAAQPAAANESAACSTAQYEASSWQRAQALKTNKEVQRPSGHKHEARHGASGTSSGQQRATAFGYNAGATLKTGHAH